MKKNERIREKYPIFDAYGSDHRFLSDAESAASNVEGRIRGIWPFLVRRVLDFHETLNAKERINYDPEDILAEVWLVLAEKDHLWAAARGRYITFAGVVIEHELASIRDKSRTVQSPRNSSCRMKRYRGEEEDGSITPRKAKTAADIRRTGCESDACLASVGSRESSDEPLSILVRGESLKECREAIISSIHRLTKFEIMIIGRLVGLWGNEPASAWLVAHTMGESIDDVRRARDRATLKIRAYLRSVKPHLADR